jgi:ubiquinone/menaquinone biosynthesis C-methylase UbiE
MGGHPIFAAIYDRALAACERDGLRDLRAELLASARGETLEIGAGTGHNLEHYPDSVARLVLAEPDPHMAKRLRPHAAEARGDAVEVIEAPAESLPFDDESFDTVVSTLVLCTVESPARAANEAHRVLRPEGRLLLIEHVRSPDAPVSPPGRIGLSARGVGSLEAAIPTATPRRRSPKPALTCGRSRTAACRRQRS